MQYIDIMCKVVDNYGDAGFCLRLVKSLGQILAQQSLRCRLVVQGLETLAALEPSVASEMSRQSLLIGGVECSIISWDEGVREDVLPAAELVIETFSSSFPAWYEAFVWDPDRAEKRFIVNIEHLGAEDFAAEYHLLPSLSPLKQVKRHFFMPGFVPGTGGLLHDRRFLATRDAIRELHGDQSQIAGRRANLLARNAVAAPEGAAERPWVSLFCYEWDAGAFIRAAHKAGFTVLVASGLGAKSAREGGLEAGSWVELPFLPQHEWDELMLLCDMNAVRGEESLARATLSGVPFVWQAYRIADDGHHPKAEAFIGRVAPFLGDSSRTWSVAMRAYNGMFARESEQDLWESVFAQAPRLREGFRNFAKSAESLGDLAQNLVTFSSY